jgi:molecular chaperone DnaK (HSP70)
MVKDNRSLARFDLKNIAPMQAGLARIDVRFLVDANGILQVTARDARTGKEQSIEVKPSYGLTDEQVEAMIDESFAKADEDMQERQVREARIEADQILKATEKAKQEDHFFDLAEDERNAINRAINELLVVYHSDDYLLIRDKIEQLNHATMRLAEIRMNTAVRSALKGTKI